METRVTDLIPVGDRYHELVRAFPLRVIRTEDELDRAIGILESLWEDSTPDVGEYRLALAMFVERYEEEHDPMGHVSPADMLRHLVAAVQAEIASSGGKFFGINLNNHSGHFMPTGESLPAAREAFAKIGIVFP